MVTYKLDDIVNEYLAEIGDTTQSRYLRFYQHAIAGIREWNMDITGVPHIVDLEVDSTDRANLPPNYLNYTRIGICGADGQVYPLAENSQICLDRHYDPCGNDASHASDYALGGVSSMSPGFMNGHFRNGEVIGRFFGAGGGQNANGYFRIDSRNGQIVLLGLSSTVTHITLEYIADIEMADKDFPVHPFLVQTLKDWIYWRSIIRDKNVNLGEKQLAERAYEKSYIKSKKRFKSKPLSEWYAAIRAGNNGAVKF